MFLGLFLSMSTYGNDNVINNIVNNSKLSVEEANQIYAWEQKYAEIYDIPVEIGLSITKKESSFNRSANNGASIGLKQINSNVWLKELNITKKCLREAECNIRNGYIILRYYVDLHNGDIKKALMSYRGSTNKITNKKYAEDVLYNMKHFS